MIKLFNANERDFNTNGILVIHPLKLKEIKKISLNGWHIEVELDLKHKDLVAQDMLAVVKTKSKLAPQAFRITDIEYTQRNMKFTAHHVVFDAHKYYLVDVRPTGMSAIGALNYVGARTDKVNPFTFDSDVNYSETAYFMDRSLMYALERIENRWGGRFQADNWHVTLSKNLGQDQGEVIAYGKNLQGIKVHEDWSSVVTRIYPIGDEGLRLPEDYIDADVQYDTPYTQRIDFNTKLEDDEKTEANMIPELRANAQQFLDESKFPKVSYEVTSDINQMLEVGDIVHVKHPLVMLEAEVQEYEYNVITKRVLKIVFGNYSRDVRKRFDEIKNGIEEVKEKTSRFESLTKEQTDLINNMNKFGHVYQDDNQILIVDTLPKEEARNVWRWNLGGLGFSETGIEGPFINAWTMDGKFNTKFIAAHSIMANQIEADFGSSLDLKSNESLNIIIGSTETEIEDKLKVMRKSTADAQLLADEAKLKAEQAQIDADSGIGSASDAKAAADEADRLAKLAQAAAINLKVSTDKYDKGELKGAKYTFNGTNAVFKGGGLKIQNNAGATVLDADTAGNLSLTSKVQVNHSDGSYTKMDGNGMKRHTSSGGKDYHYLIHATNFVQGSASGTSPRWIQLPNDFKGKNFEIFFAIADSLNVKTYWRAIQKIVCTIHPNYVIDYANARVPVIAYKSETITDSGDAPEITTVQGVMWAIY